jgi:hypothetical protein
MSPASKAATTRSLKSNEYAHPIAHLRDAADQIRRIASRGKG